MAEQLDSESRPDPTALNPETQNAESLSFEEAFRRLGEMVDSLESGGLPLAEATIIYQRGMGLVRRCNQLLNEAELKITQLTGDLGETAPTDILEWDEDPEV
jgi:exodeoxyribonuclease VII small subunit